VPRLKLTQRVVDKLRAAHGQELFWDHSFPGFGVLVSRQTRTYVVKGKIAGGRSVRRKIGRADVLSLEEARAEAKKVLFGFNAGVDPRQKKASAATLRQMLDAYVQAPTLKPRTIEFYRGTVTRYMGHWLDKPIGSITRDMVEKRHKQIAAEVEARDRATIAQHIKRHLQRAERTEKHYPGASERHRIKWQAARERKPRTGYGVADGAMRCLRAVINAAVDKDSSLINPVKLKKQWFKVKRRARLVKADDLKKFYDSVMALKNPVARDYLRLLLYTGLRRREAAGLTWQNVDFRARVIRVPASSTKSGEKLDLPMSDLVHDLLVSRRAVGNAKFIFPANSAVGHISEPKFALAEVATACGVTVSVHDLRRTFISTAESCDLSPLALKCLVNHAIPNDVTSGYVVMSTERLRVAGQRVADRLKELCGIEQLRGKNVARLHDRD
jgi:integrase